MKPKPKKITITEKQLISLLDKAFWHGKNDLGQWENKRWYDEKVRELSA